MGFRDILLCVDPVPAASSLIENAVKLAKKQKANLTGLYPLEIFEVPGYVEAQLPKDILEKHRSYHAEQAREAEAAFRKACTSAGIRWDWRCVEGDRAESVIANGRLADLVLLTGSRDGSVLPTGESTSRILLECGRPVLLIPGTPINKEAGSRILLAWNGRREAVRAVHDALPLLRSADWVKIVMVNLDTSAADFGDFPGSELCRHLSRHGVEAEAREARVRGKSEGAALLELAMKENANLLVMGAYGHSRWRELALGGVTAHVLRNADLPVFMSH